MAKVICKLENASEEISGVKFEPHPEGLGMLSEDISDEEAARLASIPGFELVGAIDAALQAELDDLSARAKELGIKVKGNWKIDRLRNEVEVAERAKASQIEQGQQGSATDAGSDTGSGEQK